MFNVVIFGPPGSGKGTQSKMIVEKYDLQHVSTGDLLRSEIARQTPLGKTAQTFMDKGHLVPDEVVIGMISTVLETNKESKGFLFDGFPRTVAQAEAFEKLFKLNNAEVDVVIVLNVEQEELVKRILNRSLTSGREDDNEETVRERLVEYQKKTAPVADFYRHLNKVKTIKGEGEIQDVFASISQTIDIIKKAKNEH